MKDPIAQRISYVEHLNPAEKLVIWNKKLDLLSNTSTLSADQKQIISELSNHLAKNVFENIASRDKFMKDFGNSWTYRAEKIFSREQVIRFFTSINMDDDNLNLTSNVVKPNSDEQPKCKCSVISDYCPQYYYCTNWNCEQSSFGCGFLLLYICDGLCQ